MKDLNVLEYSGLLVWNGNTFVATLLRGNKDIQIVLDDIVFKKRLKKIIPKYYDTNYTCTYLREDVVRKLNSFTHLCVICWVYLEKPVIVKPIEDTPRILRTLKDEFDTYESNTYKGDPYSLSLHGVYYWYLTRKGYPKL